MREGGIDKMKVSSIGCVCDKVKMCSLERESVGQFESNSLSVSEGERERERERERGE